jgi:tetratricopeptide (TPR) repeat protein
LPLLERALSINEKVLRPDDPGLFTNLNNLALLYKAQGEYSKAEPLLKRSLAIAETSLGPEHPSVASMLNNLAELYRRRG